MHKWVQVIVVLLLLTSVLACGGGNEATDVIATPALASDAPATVVPPATPTPLPLPTLPPVAAASPTPLPVATNPEVPSDVEGPAVQETAAMPVRTMVLETPQNGMVVRSPVQVRGRVSVTPFESTLRARVYDAQGLVVGEVPITMVTEMGQPGTFEGQIPFQVAASGPGRVEIAEISMADGSIVISAVANVGLEATGASSNIEIPAAGARVTLPLHILARVGQPGEQVTASLRWQDGTELTNNLTVLQGEDGGGLIVDSIDWMMESQPPQPPSQPARLELRDAAGTTLAAQEVQVLSHDDPDVRRVSLYFVLGEQLQEVPRFIVNTEGIGAATLDELLWGPPPLNLAGFETAIPTPEEVLAFHARGADWGPRVTLNKLTIVDGLATADFSQEMLAHGGGSLRVMLLRQQIEQTLRQFSTVQDVVIAVEGETEGVLEP